MFNLLQPSALSLFVTDSETLTMMWQTVVLGMMMVFAVLAILWFILSVFKRIFAGGEPEKEDVEPVSVESYTPEAITPEENVVSSEDTDDMSGELLAVITAAVAAYMAEENGGEAPVGGFRVVSFRRTGARAWNAK